MYHHFYGLRELPFELTPNPKFLFLPPQHREALSNLQYGLSSAKGITVLIGEAGTGKTTLLRAAFDSEMCRNVSCVYLNNPALTRGEFVEMLAHRFELGLRARESKAVLLEELDRVLRERRSRGQITALVIDEAQSLSAELLEEIRLLANNETMTEKLLPLVLTGQPELRDRLNEPGLRQLKQRVTLRCEIAPLGLDATAGYIAARVRTAGGDARHLFTREAVVLIHEQSHGIPRTISVVCDNALMTGFALGRKPVDRDTVLQVGRDFDLAGEATPVVGDGDRAGDGRRDVPAPARPGTVEQPQDPGFGAAPGMTEPETSIDQAPALFAEVGRPRRFSLFSGR
jgi:general secretion pathway protein A